MPSLILVCYDAGKPLKQTQSYNYFQHYDKKRFILYLDNEPYFVFGNNMAAVFGHDSTLAARLKPMCTIAAIFGTSPYFINFNLIKTRKL